MSYWLKRKFASLKMAYAAASPEARAAHMELAARYDANAARALAQAIEMNWSTRASGDKVDPNMVTDEADEDPTEEIVESRRCG